MSGPDASRPSVQAAARARVTRGVYRGACLLAALAVARDLVVSPPWVWVPPALTLALLAPAALRGSTGPAARAWFMLIVHGLTIASLYVLGIRTAAPLVVVGGSLAFIMLAWEERALLLASLTATALNLGLLVFAHALPFGPPIEGLEGTPQFGFVLTVSVLTVVAGAAWFARTLSAATQAATERAEAGEASSDAKTRFLATMSHELRTPAAAILGYADLLQLPDVDDATQRAHAAVVARNGRHLLALLDDLLDLSKVEAGALSIAVEDVDVAELVCDAVDALSARPEAGDEIEIRAEASTPWPSRVETDPRRARQVLLNLLTNAAKFAERQVTLTVTAREGWLELIVDDDGPGVPEDEVDRLFDAFWQGTAGKAAKKGTGLGLMLCRHLAGLMGGGLRFVPREGPGARFVFSLPSHAEVPLRPPGPVEPVRVSQPSARVDGRLDGLRFLLAEDSADLRTLLTFELERRGAAVDAASDGQEALELAASSPHDLILMDVDMPRVDGLTATRRLRARGVHTPVIALTAFAMRGDRERCLEAGCDAYLGKPVDFASLLATIARLTSREPRAEEGTLGERRAEEALAAVDSSADAPGSDEDAVPAKLRALREGYARRVPERLEELRALLDAGDRAGLAHASHKLAGAAGSFGFPALGEAARALEEATTAGEPLERLEACLGRLEAAAAPPQRARR